MALDAETLVTVLSAVAIGVILFRKWIWRGVKLLLRTAVAGVVLQVLAWSASLTGLQLGVNLVNALVLGILGLPGLGLLWALQQL
jgi:inhibitor of the pro-sigma K processing machinery